MNELALFAGAGGGILGGHLLGWRTVCAVEWEPYPASVLCARQNDGLLPTFPIWDDVQTFDGRPWRGIVDVISGGFPCQDISAAGKGVGIEGEPLECGEKWRGSFTKYDPDTSSWKTHQCSLLGDLESFSETWPQWGLMRNGECWEQTTLERTIRGTGFGFVPNGVDNFHTPNTTGLDGGSNSRRALKKRLQNWPTPNAWDGKRGPRSEENLLNKKHQINLITAVKQAEREKLLPTPNARDWKDGKTSGNRKSPGLGVVAHQLDTQTGGQLNPTWVEWLMGWPLGWSELKPLEMGKSHSVPPPHGES